ncbi:ABC transporter ATP-binding protein [Pontibacillus yanchengensis]|uniref:Peptide ABC transporter ATP-binding protein n=1 Tax=Pontibacillus yanchengensis Y32 TaxID=1385514 RepID=A0A0A2TEE6_9BACI|nr:ABC transporter ATP-binding protein [Pontibacillus yanchengensis]KGP72788.1 peptide ABC transporter ATP-binding protein [Pontibacillus yanchengensis Y32]
MSNILEVKDLVVSFHTFGGEVQAVRGVNFSVPKGKTVAIVGESGCGKSVTAKSIMQLLPKPPAEYKQGEILFNGDNILAKSERDMQRIRGNEIGMIFQDPMTSLNPTTKVGAQITEGILKHKDVSRKEARSQAIELLNLVGIPQPEKRVDQYPHEFSGGMRQRAMIAISLACEPDLLIADEPTTALDVTIQAQILKLMKDLQNKTGTSIILITHDLGVVAETCDHVVVMYAGQVIETGTVEEVFETPQHPYTKGLMKSVPRLDQDKKQPLIPIIGSPPDLMDPTEGCPFFARCEYAMEVCRDHNPSFEYMGGNQHASCWLHHPLAKASE